jgi:GT2 family glycosyltransferase
MDDGAAASGHKARREGRREDPPAGGAKGADEPRTSALIVNYNGADTLERCLASLPADPPGGLETIVVDNASTDGSQAIVRRRFAGMRLVPLAANLGFGAAVNRAAAEARGDRLLLLNNDAWLAPGSLEALGTRLDADPGLGWVSPRLRYPDGRHQTAWVPDVGVAGESVQRLRNRLERFGFNHLLVPRLLERLGMAGWLTAACALLRRRAFDEVGGFDERFFLYFEDADLGRRLRLAGWRLAEEPAATAFHASAGRARGGRVELEYRRSQLRYYDKHRPSREARWLRRHLRRKYRRRDDETARRVLALIDREPAAGAG